MGEIREWIDMLLVPVLIPLFFALRMGWRQFRRKYKAVGIFARRETRRANTYRDSASEAIDILEFKNRELQLHNESLEARNISLTESISRISKAIPIDEAVES